ncbi:hypothetical protein CSOJ01_05654 [Colletotrichum sojae]|uniref:Uncharacterized protein n=1 Tax=Colletotrichum sojae TaxID=2175907 RepID=A0A8H6JF88_9PEZI|nr:hypothetical protein CSOJ01_05654 [Colletotrichum sojae]
MVSDLHVDLVRKWKRHGPAIEAYWRSFDKRLRTKCLKEGGAVLKHPNDRSFVDAYKLIPEIPEKLILARQMYILQPMNIAIEVILEEGSKSRARKEPPKAPIDAASAALTKLNIRERPTKMSLPELIASARDQKASLDGYLSLLSSEPVVLAYDVNFWFFSRPELVPDEKGRSLPQHTDRYITGSFFDAIHNAVKGAAIWNYIDRLLERLDGHGKDKVQRAITLQEISNICHLEYARAQALFKRQAQTGSGFKLFKRMSNAVDAAGNPRVRLKGKPEDFLRSDPQLHYILRLCHPDTNAIKVVDLIKKLSELHQAHPAEREKLTEREAKSLGDLAVIVAFIQDLSPAVSMPSLSRKKGQLFVSRAQELEAEFNRLKKDLDVGDFVVPIDNLLEPGMAEGALKTLDAFVFERSGTKLGFLSEPRERLVEQRKAKEKKRSSQSSAYEIAPAVAVTAPTTEPATSAQTFKVSASTAAVFQALFNKSESRRPVSWAPWRTWASRCCPSTDPSTPSSRPTA